MTRELLLLIVFTIGLFILFIKRLVKEFFEIKRHDMSGRERKIRKANLKHTTVILPK